MRYKKVETNDDDAAWRRLLQGGDSPSDPVKMKGDKGAAVLVVLVIVLVMVAGVSGCLLYSKQQGIKQAEEQKQAQIAAHNDAVELKKLQKEASDLIAHQDKTALNDPATLDNLNSLVASQSSSAADLQAGITAVKDSRKPASDGLSYDEWVKKADDFIAQVKASNTSKEAASAVSVYSTIVRDSGNAEELKNFVEENQRLL